MDKKIENIVISRSELYLFIKEYCGNDYAFGLHAIDVLKGKKDIDFPKDKSESIKNSIIKSGLRIKGRRTLLGTVAFASKNNINNMEYSFTQYHSDEELINTYNYGSAKQYVIVALPKVLRSDSGEEFFVGRPENGNTNETQGYQLASLSDAILPDYSETNSSLDSMFILGSFTDLGNSQISVELNPKHILFNKGIVPEYFFDRRKLMLANTLDLYGIDYPLDQEIPVEKLKHSIDKLNDKLKFDEYLNSLDDESYDRFCEGMEEGNFEDVPESIRDIFKRMIERENIEEGTLYIPGDVPVILMETIRQLINERYKSNISFETSLKDSVIAQTESKTKISEIKGQAENIITLQKSKTKLQENVNLHDIEDDSKRT